MASFFHATVAEFLAQTNEHVFAQLTLGYANRGFTTQFTDQTLTWGRDVHSLRATLERCTAASAASYASSARD